MGDDIVNLDGSIQLSLKEDLTATVFNRNFSTEFTIAWGMKLP